ncbi:MAG: hypothetical protein KDA22_06795, partial [Phycisphaerales bacterium]|nr:hypothetical protein [Phycisphaerales bacterium]
RIDEVEAVRHALRTVLDSGAAAGAVVCGDYNLVGSRVPLERLLLKTDVDGGDLAVAEALQIDGRSNATWADAKQPFTAGRLDYLVYSDATLRETGGFVFDAADLGADRLAALSLSASETADASDHLPLVVDLAWAAPDSSGAGKAQP